MNRLPGRKRPSSSLADEDERVVGVLQDAVDDDVVFGEGLGDGPPPELFSASARPGRSGSRS